MGGAGSSRLSEKRFQKRDSGAQGGLPALRETDFAPLSGMSWAGWRLRAISGFRGESPPPDFLLNRVDLAWGSSSVEPEARLEELQIQPAYALVITLDHVLRRAWYISV